MFNVRSTVTVILRVFRPAIELVQQFVLVINQLDAQNVLLQ